MWASAAKERMTPSRGGWALGGFWAGDGLNSEEHKGAGEGNVALLCRHTETGDRAQANEAADTLSASTSTHVYQQRSARRVAPVLLTWAQNQYLLGTKYLRARTRVRMSYCIAFWILTLIHKDICKTWIWKWEMELFALSVFRHETFKKYSLSCKILFLSVKLVSSGLFYKRPCALAITYCITS